MHIEHYLKINLSHTLNNTGVYTVHFSTVMPFTLDFLNTYTCIFTDF